MDGLVLPYAYLATKLPNDRGLLLLLDKQFSMNDAARSDRFVGLVVHDFMLIAASASQSIRAAKIAGPPGRFPRSGRRLVCHKGSPRQLATWHSLVADAMAYLARLRSGSDRQSAVGAAWFGEPGRGLSCS